MGWEIALVLGLLIAAIGLFSTEKLSVDLVTLALLIILIACGILSTGEAFAGFSSDFVIILACLFVVTSALETSGLLDVLIGRFVTSQTTSANGLLFHLMWFTSLVGAFLNNTTITAMLINPVLGLARKTNTSPSKLMIPLAYSAIVGGNCTLIGTSTNVAVSGYLAKNGMPPLGMFEIFPIGVIVTVIFMAYMMTIGKKLLPDAKPTDLEDSYALRDYLSEVVIMPASPLIGQKVFESNLSRLDFRILGLIRNQLEFAPTPGTRMEQGDLLLVEGKMEELLKVKETNGIQLKADTLDFYDAKAGELRLGEVLLPARSTLVNRTIREINFRQRFGLVVMAIHRSGQTLHDKVSNIELLVGDLMLVQGAQERFTFLKKSRDLIILDEYKPTFNARRKGLLTLVFFVAAIVVGTLGLVPLSVAFLTAAVLTVLIKAITVEQAYSSIDWRLLILIGGMSAFGTAMAHTGTDVFLSVKMVNLFKPFGTTGVLAGFILLTVLLTQPMSNAGAALVVLPIALQTAGELHVNPRTFAMAVMLSASVSLITPFEPSCILVYGPGKYRFVDFLKVGTGITLLLMIALLLLVPYYWPL
ncbi:MAG: SLC13 family permease [Ferruginibacter sp.]|nr:SLC13 family permease [Cytophagales bacterium]